MQKRNKSQQGAESPENRSYAILKPFDELMEKCKNIPAMPEPEYACKKCNDSGWVFFVDTQGVERSGQCTCKVQKRQRQLAKKAGFDIETAKRISDWKTNDNTLIEFKETVIDYVKKFDCLGGKNNLLLLGQSGSGKTHLGRAVIKALIERTKPVQATAVLYFSMMSELKSNAMSDDYNDRLKKYTDVNLLLIDDYCKEKAYSGSFTEPDIKHLFPVIDGRYRNGKPTIITSECTPERLQELDEAIYWRLRENAFAEIVFAGTNQNYRRRAI